MKFKDLPKPKIVSISQLNEKAQLVIPKAARNAIDLGPGDRVVIAVVPFAQAILIAKPEQMEAQLQEMVNDTQASLFEMQADLNKIKENGEE